MRKFLLVIVALILGLGTLIIGGGGVAQASSCASLPSGCGYPDSTNTGFVGSLTTVGSNVTINTGGSACNQAAIYELKDITGTITVNASNVLIRNVRVTVPAGVTPTAVVDVVAGKTCVGIQHSTIIGNSTPGQTCVGGLGAGSTTIATINNDISGCTVGYRPIGASGNNFNHNYVHGFSSTDAGASVFRGINIVSGVSGGSGISHNTIVMPGSAVDAVGIEVTGVDGSGVISNDNFILGGVYNLKLTATGTVAGTASVTRNRLNDATSTGYMLRNRAITTTGTPTNTDDITGADINASL